MFALCTESMSANVSFKFSYGMNNPTLKERMQTQVSRLLNAINEAAESDRDINFSGISISDNAAQALSMTWNVVHFHTEDDAIVEACLTRRNKNSVVRGYQIRNVGVTLIPINSEPLPAERQELCIDFSPYGEIDDINFTMDNSQYVKMLSEGEKLGDVEQRMQILGWCEKFKQAYIDKNIGFMEDVFSDDALIITGKVVTSRREGVYKSNIQLDVKGKAEYLAGLRRVFALPGNIKVNFSQYQVMRHPTNPDIYYVTLVQDWKAPNYSDEGIVVLVWNFKDEDHPEILVRTWQPMGTKPFDYNDIPVW